MKTHINFRQYNFVRELFICDMDKTTVELRTNKRNLRDKKFYLWIPKASEIQVEFGLVVSSSQ